MSTAGCAKAKNPANQSLVERIFLKRKSLPPPKHGGRNHFSLNLKNAEDSLRKAKNPITTYADALAIKGIGPKIAYILFPDGSEEIEPKRPKRGSMLLESPASSTTSSSSNLPKRKRHTGEDASLCCKSMFGASAKVQAYEKAVADSLNWKAQSRDLLWKVILIVDEREREKTHMESKCLMAKIPCERRTLPIGDMAWIARAFHKDDRTEKPVVELMLGTIIERKSISDLVQSIKGSRYVEQRMRMKESGLPQLLFMVEGDLHKDSRNAQEFKMCYTAMYETRLHLNFQIVQTANMTDTVQTLKRLHRRILKRTFPSAFYAEALPIFSGPDLDHRQQQGQSMSELSSRISSPEAGRTILRRRRKNESLQEMRFDIEPTLFGGMERFITYEEFKAKVEMGRESASRSIAMIHVAMLKQVPRVENKKIQAITAEYPTPNSLYSAYHSLDSEQQKKELFSSMSLSDDTHAAKRFVGPQSSLCLYASYGMTKDASHRLSYEALAEQMNKSHSSTQGAQTKSINTNGSLDEIPSQGDVLVRSTFETALRTDVPAPVLPECIEVLSSDEEMDRKPAALPKTLNNDKSSTTGEEDGAWKMEQESLDSPSPCLDLCVSLGKNVLSQPAGLLKTDFCAFLHSSDDDDDGILASAPAVMRRKPLADVAVHNYQIKRQNRQYPAAGQASSHSQALYGSKIIDGSASLSKVNTRVPNSETSLSHSSREVIELEDD